MTKHDIKPWVVILLMMGFIHQNQPALGQVTWSNDIACIIYSHCSSCHNESGIAPFSLMSYDDVYDFRFSIEDVIERRYMPPWPADPDYRHFQNENVLSDEEILRFKEWVADQAPEGNLSDAPEPPELSDGPTLKDADLILKLPVYEVPPLNDKDLYRCFVFDIDLPEDAFITAFEVIPGNPAIVHHALLYESNSSQIEILDAQDPDPGYVCFGGIGVGNVRGLGGWVPGSEAHYFPDGMGIKLPSKTKVVVQVHYPEYGAGQVDSTKVLFKLSYDDLREMGNAPVLNHSAASLTNGPLFIPANTIKTFHNRFTIPTQATIYSITPHAHLICEAMRSFAVTPTGDTINLIDIPQWDFDWQKTYDFRKPIVLPGGTVLHGYARYNNTSSNDHNPNIPPKDVSLGEATTDEMMLFYFNFSAWEPGDEDIVFEEDGHFAHHLDCEYDISTSTSTHEEVNLSVFPNPTSGMLNIQSNQSIQEVRIHNSMGHLIRNLKYPDGSPKISTSNWVSGIYYVEVFFKGQKRLVRIAVD